MMLCGVAVAAVENEVDAILQRSEPPPGVVFEIEQAEENALDWAMPKVNRSVEKLRERFPRLDIAVVSHGQEMLALQSNRREHDQKAHDLAQRLTKQQGVPVYVCETFAAAKQLTAEAFPEYVKTASSGQARIDDYVALGYVLVKVTKPGLP
jgi:intracellular sulfur oxidation DsrE/DsrF family protein